MKKVWKSINIWCSYGQEFDVLFFFDSRCSFIFHASSISHLLCLRYERRSIVITVSVCLSVCLSESISPELHVRSSPNFYACYICPRLGPPLAALRYVMYFQFMDDVIFAHNGPYAGCWCNTGTASQPDSAARWLGRAPWLKQQALTKPVTLWCRLLQTRNEVCVLWQTCFALHDV